MENKIALRHNAKEIRKTLDMEKISKILCEKLRENDYYKSAKHVMLFYPTKTEVTLLEILNDNKNFYLPRVFGKDLQVCPYRLGDKLVRSSFGVLEPVCSHVNKDCLDLVIVPALMADKRGYRLGYGGGYYDRFLRGLNSKIYTITLIPECLLKETLPVDDFDIAVNEVIFC